MNDNNEPIKYSDFNKLESDNIPNPSNESIRSEDLKSGDNCDNNTIKKDNNSPKNSKDWWSTSIWKYVIAGVLSGIFIAGFLWIADRFGSMWGGIIATIPVSLIAAIIFIKPERLHNFTFALILGTIAYLVAAVVFFVSCTSYGFGKWANLGIALFAWLIVTAVLFYSFRGRFCNEKLK